MDVKVGTKSAPGTGAAELAERSGAAERER
jgi:hypothetical protein